jgi:hypothetical protein
MPVETPGASAPRDDEMHIHVGLLPPPARVIGPGCPGPVRGPDDSDVNGVRVTMPLRLSFRLNARTVVRGTVTAARAAGDRTKNRRRAATLIA